MPVPISVQKVKPVWFFSEVAMHHRQNGSSVFGPGEQAVIEILHKLIKYSAYN
jgi:hypothetical protein